MNERFDEQASTTIESVIEEIPTEAIDRVAAYIECAKESKCRRAQTAWVWLYVVASCIAIVNIVVLAVGDEIFWNEELFLVTVGTTLGFLFGHVGVSALWAAWGPANWLTNHAIAIGSLGVLLTMSFVGTLMLDDDTFARIVLAEGATIAIIVAVLLAALHLARRFGRWRLLPQGAGSRESGPAQISLRGILVMTTLVAGMLALARGANHALGLDFELMEMVELAAISGIVALVIGATLIAPCFVFFAVVHRCYRGLYAGLALAFGYVVPLIVVLWLLDFDADELEDALAWLYALVPLQCAATGVAALEFGMLYAAGMRLTRLARNVPEVQRSAVGS